MLTSASGGDMRGFTLVEILMIIVVLAIGLPVVVMMLGIGTKQSVNAEVRIVGVNAAQAMMEEIQSKRWDETPAAPSGLIGAEGGEVRTTCSGTPSSFDDIDDYNGYVETCGGYTTTVLVCYVNASDLNLCVASPPATAWKRIQVSVAHPQTGSDTIVSVMTNH